MGQRASMAALVAASIAAACSATVVDDGTGGGDGGAAGGNGEAGGGAMEEVLCPGAPPDAGVPCSDDTLSCMWGAECMHQAICEDGAWFVTRVGDCTDPDGCPSEQPTGACEEPGLSCTYGLGDGCGGTLEVTCVDGTWTVTDSPCDFVCPTDPEELPSPCDPCCHHRCFYDGPDFCDEWEGTCNADGTWTVTRPLC